MWYAVIVAALSLAGAAVPLVHRPSHAQLQIYLSLAAGALLGAAMFHLLPESAHHIGGDFGLAAVLGIAVVFFLQRYVAPHSHELESNGPGHHHTAAAEHQHERGWASGREPDHAHAHPEDVARAGCGSNERHRAAGPFLSGFVAIVALSIHSFFDGVAIGAAAGAEVGSGAALTLAVFLSVLIHKPMDGVSVSVLLLQAGVGRGKLWVVQVGYALLVPVGAAAFLFTEGRIGGSSALVGYTLAFSAGMFLAIALTDLLPELHFHSHDRNKLSAALLTGLAIMWVTSLIGHGETPHDHDHGSAAQRTETFVMEGGDPSGPCGASADAGACSPLGQSGPRS